MFVRDLSVPDTGKSGAGPTCGVKPRNQHSLREGGACDWMKFRTPAERAAILAKKQPKAEEEAA